MERVLTQYFKRVCKIWSSGLSGYNKIHILQCICSYCIDTNFGLLVWTINEIDSFDKKKKKKRKILTMTGNFRKNSVTLIGFICQENSSKEILKK